MSEDAVRSAVTDDVPQSGPESPAPGPDSALLEAAGISKSFGAVQALADGSLELRRAEVHALVGENGAGKSTLIKVLSGVTRADGGEVRVDGRPVRLDSPSAARRLGLGTVFQELSLLPWMTVAENLLIDQLPRGRAGLVRRRSLPSEAEKVLAHFGIETIDPREIPERLSLAERQVVEIVRALHRRPRILFLDEATASLPKHQVDWLFETIDRERSAGCCVVFTSHRWKEVEQIADRITVFRNGRKVATRPSLNESEAVTLMTGRRVGEIYPPRPRAQPDAPALLEVEDLHADGVDGVSFSLRRGEVLGIGGLAGQGQRELFLSLYGVRRPGGGKITVGGREQRIRRPADAIRAHIGIALVPEDRKGEGLLLPLPIRDNLTLPILRRLSTGGLVRRADERKLVEGLMDQLQIGGGRRPTEAVETLSGGNQQKVLVGRWLLAESEILLFYDVTRGVDVATKHDLYELIASLAAEGRGILLYSSDTDEIAHLCERVLVMREGRVARQLTGAEVDTEKIVAASVMEEVAANG
ncbi:MAG TPA: sugar ABC transporter ATP-binding protein [Streptosporangiaceae bacterium]|nr:sugar ABC transporter ATP-binding protein [Streptosporangiaceae bacterium]